MMIVKNVFIFDSSLILKIPKLLPAWSKKVILDKAIY